ncbi:hypothetical protein QEJ31_11795 [Pigmentibacter sp. JX0631]|uniref:hypothetical protein n=1 Tax=Pigmentibacter sp. JX0631 TaxID=2976982 RepID=UPI00246858C8|nr:hypothetical protein [Pigmentibacter sp. JX0631]WGL59204.1 hypothetical protein QEJ31_11795 [Pigmentibacter sp. JX0631]
MSEIEEMLNHYEPYKSTNGMIILDLLEHKKMSMEDLYSVLGTTSIAMEFILGKRLLSHKQIEKLAEIFGILPEIFSLDEQGFSGSSSPSYSENQQNNFQHSSNEENSSFQSEFGESNNQFDINKYNEEFNEADEFKPPAFQAKPFWED